MGSEIGIRDGSPRWWRWAAAEWGGARGWHAAACGGPGKSVTLCALRARRHSLEASPEASLDVSTLTELLPPGVYAAAAAEDGCEAVAYRPRPLPRILRV